MLADLIAVWNTTIKEARHELKAVELARRQGQPGAKADRHRELQCSPFFCSLRVASRLFPRGRDGKPGEVSCQTSAPRGFPSRDRDPSACGHWLRVAGPWRDVQGDA